MPLRKMAYDIGIPQVHGPYSVLRVASRWRSISSKSTSHVGSSLAHPNHCHGISSCGGISCTPSGTSTWTISLRLINCTIASRAKRMASSRLAASTVHAGSAGIETCIPPSGFGVTMMVYFMSLDPQSAHVHSEPECIMRIRVCPGSPSRLAPTRRPACPAEAARAPLPRLPYLCQRRLRLWQPEGHVHVTVQVDGRGQGGTGLLPPTDLHIQGAKATVAVGLEWTHPQLLG